MIKGDCMQTKARLIYSDKTNWLTYKINLISCLLMCMWMSLPFFRVRAGVSLMLLFFGIFALAIVLPTIKLMESETYKSMPYSKVFADDMAKGHVVYYGESSAKIQSHIREAVESVMLAGVSPEDALQTLKRKVQEVLDEG